MKKMNKATRTILLLLVVSGVILAGAWYRQGGAVKAATPGARKVLFYVDPMHPAYKSDKPGIAPDCGMDLEPVYEDGAGPTAEPGSAAPSVPRGAIQVSADKQQMIGLKTGVVELAPGEQKIHA